eukprot:Hpha_TRINITY_DN16423_c1_g2::TRINITY_DN16423_c1_g2_i1::g.162001::m.162001
MKAMLVVALSCLFAVSQVEGRLSSKVRERTDNTAELLRPLAGVSKPLSDAEQARARQKYRDIWNDKLIALAEKVGSTEAQKVRAELKEIWDGDDEYRVERESIREQYRNKQLSKAEYKEKVATIKKPSRSRLGVLLSELKAKVKELGVETPAEASVKSTAVVRNLKKEERMERYAKRWRRRVLAAAAEKGFNEQRLNELQKEVDELLAEQTRVIEATTQWRLSGKPYDDAEQKERRVRLRVLNTRRRDIENEIVGDASGNQLHERRQRTAKLNLIVWRAKLVKKIEAAGMSQEWQSKLEKEADKLIEQELSVVGTRELWPEPNSPKTPEQRQELRARVKELKESRKRLWDSVEDGKPSHRSVKRASGEAA